MRTTSFIHGAISISQEIRTVQQVGGTKDYLVLIIQGHDRASTELNIFFDDDVKVTKLGSEVV